MPDPARTPGRVYLEAVLAGEAPPPPFAALLQMRLTEVGDGTTTFEMPVRDSLYNPNAVMHGGAIASLVDSAMGLAVLSTLGAEENFTTAEIKVNYLRPITTGSGPLRAIGRVVHRGRQVVVAEGDVFDVAGRLMARATSTNLVLASSRGRAPTGSEASAPGTEVVATTGPRAGPTGITPAMPAAPVATIPFSAPASRLEQPPRPSVLPTASAIIPAPLARSKQHIRLFVGDMAFLRQGQGPPVVLLHGMPSSSYLWRDLLDPLGAHFDVIAPDLVGYGDSEKRLDAELSVAAQARYVIAFMEALQVHEAAIIGHDIGGGIAQLITTDDPTRVARLTLIDSVVDNNWPIEDVARFKQPGWDQAMAGFDFTGEMRKTLEAGIVSPGRVSDELVDEYVRPFAGQDGRRAYLRATRALHSRDLVSRATHIRDITVPTLILWGANDRFLDPRWAAELQRKLPNAQVQLIDPGGHFLPLDRPEAVADALLRFLTS